MIILLTKITESITGRKFEMPMVIWFMEVNSYKPLPKVIPLFCLCCFFFFRSLDQSPILTETRKIVYRQQILLLSRIPLKSNVPVTTS